MSKIDTTRQVGVRITKIDRRANTPSGNPVWRLTTSGGSFLTLADSTISLSLTGDEIGLATLTIENDRVVDLQLKPAQVQNNTHVTTDGTLVKVGQVWRSLDRRDNGRQVTVETITDGIITVKSYRRSRLPVARMSLRYELVKS